MLRNEARYNRHVIEYEKLKCGYPAVGSNINSPRDSKGLITKEEALATYKECSDENIENIENIENTSNVGAGYASLLDGCKERFYGFKELISPLMASLSPTNVYAASKPTLEEFNAGYVYVGTGIKITGNTVGGKINNLYLEPGKNNDADVPALVAVRNVATDMNIGVTTSADPTTDVDVPVTTAENQKDYSDYFTSDKGFCVANVGTGSGQQVVLTNHFHSWTYDLSKANAENDTITATCGGEGTCPVKNKSLTIVKPAHATYGDGKNAKATLTGTKIGDLIVSASDIKYVGTGSTTYAESTTAPTKAGKYKASISVGSEDPVTAYVEYTISKATPTPAEKDKSDGSQTKSGDSTNLLLSTMLMTLALIAAAATLLCRRRER